MGAYQDIMGDLHNLFGRVNEVHVFLDETEPGGYYIEEIIKGNNIAGVLSWIQYSATDLEKRVKEQIDHKVREGVIKPREGVELLNFYEEVLNGYTYMDVEKQSKHLLQSIAASAGGTALGQRREQLQDQLRDQQLPLEAETLRH
jgi:arginine decarboxylase